MKEGNPEVSTATAYRQCKCGHPESDHEAVGLACVYGWDEWQALDAKELVSEPCNCESFTLEAEVLA